MRALDLALVLVPLALIGCGDGSGSDDDTCQYVDMGECQPPAGSTPLAVPVTQLLDGCYSHSDTGVTIFESAEAWDAMYGLCMPAPAEVDFATQRLALVTSWCTYTEPRFVVETAGEIIIGIHESAGGACIEAPVLVTLPRGPKPVRAARCVNTGVGDCPPLA